tara:strand:- start:297 stop:1049 length:753 start_codon:yes stop_codon:yes gene_type:complete
MKNINHPYGNLKISFTKSVKKILLSFLRFLVNFFYKLENDDEIIISSGVHAPWLKDKEFNNFYEVIKEFTLLDPPRAYTLWQCSKNLRSSPGNILDVGCLLGGAGFLMNKANKTGKTFLFDTFSGFKKDDGLHKKDTFFFNDISFVKKNISKLKLKKISVHKSYFPKGLKFPVHKIKLCHIDVNTYTSTKEVFEYVDKRLIRSGIIIFDDFGIWGVDGIKKYIYKIYPKFKKRYHFLFNYMGQCILIKKV